MYFVMPHWKNKNKHYPYYLGVRRLDSSRLSDYMCKFVKNRESEVTNYVTQKFNIWDRYAMFTLNLKQNEYCSSSSFNVISGY